MLEPGRWGLLPSAVGELPTVGASDPPSANRSHARAHASTDRQTDSRACALSQTRVQCGAGASTFSHSASTVPAWMMATCSSFLRF